MIRRMRNRRRMMSVSLSIALVLPGLLVGYPQAEGSEAASLPVANPRVSESGPTTWDCVWFGNYWQNDTNKDRRANRKDDKEPIKWRVLSVDEEEIFLLADQNLDVMPWDSSEYSTVTWRDCSMRSWLNGYRADFNLEEKDYSADNFLDQAFTEEEQSVIVDSLVVNADNPIYHTMGGKDTTDKVFLLSADEAINPAYGFSDELEGKSESRVSSHTEFVWHGGTIETSSVRITEVANSGTNSYWWLRTPGNSGKTWVNRYGGIAYSGQDRDSDYIAVRPALRMKRSAFTEGFCQYAGFVESDADQYELHASEIGRKVTNPRVNLKEKKTTWDCVWFGNYWQNDTAGDGIADEKQPILWRVLEVEDSNVFLVSDRILDYKKYNEDEDENRRNVTWETCTLRSWLNGYDATANICEIDYQKNNFFTCAFSEKEQKAVLQTKLVNKGVFYEVDGGNDTTDRVFCLSYDDVVNTWEYGFYLGDSLRQAKSTSYAGLKGMEYQDAWWEDWWLRTTGYDNTFAATVSKYGVVYGNGSVTNCPFVAVRPALYVNLSKIDATSFKYAGTVTRYEGGRMELLDAPLNPTPAVSPSASPQETPTMKPSEEPGGTVTNRPLETPVVEPSQEPTEMPTEDPAETPSGKPSPVSSESPAETPSPAPTEPPTEPPSAKPTEKPSVQAPGAFVKIPSGNASDRTNLWAEIRSVKLSSNNAPVIRWKKNSKADGYQLYRSRKKNTGYRLIKEISSSGVLRYIDNKTSGKKRYYYRILSCKTTAQGKIHGGFSKTYSIKTLNLIRPKIKVKKGVTASQIPYIELRLKRYRGTQLSIYYRIGKGKYKRLKLTSSSIEKNRGRFKIQCAKIRRTYYFRVKTSIRKKGKRYYSKYSNVVKIRR